jgi:5,10-methenyltetrahydrofolate synthetase
MYSDELKTWRKTERSRLIAARVALDHATLERYRQAIDAHLARSFPGLASAKLAFCWPIKGEYDARHLARTLRERGALTALPVVVAPKQPLMLSASGIPAWNSRPGRWTFPIRQFARSRAERRAAADERLGPAGYRLGYGGGFFDRTLAFLAEEAGGHRRDLRDGEDGHHPSAKLGHSRWTGWSPSAASYRRDGDKLVFLGEPPAGEPSKLASPVCYADEIAPGYFGEDRT